MVNIFHHKINSYYLYKDKFDRKYTKSLIYFIRHGESENNILGSKGLDRSEYEKVR